MKEMIIALQEAVAHQGDDLLRLSEELHTQQKEIAVLRKQLKDLRDKFQAVTEGDAVSQTIGQEAPPPHY